MNHEQQAVEELILDLTQQYHCTQHEGPCYRPNGQCLRMNTAHLKAWARAIVRIVMNMLLNLSNILTIWIINSIINAVEWTLTRHQRTQCLLLGMRPKM